VREGMALYLERQAGRAPSTLEDPTRRSIKRAPSLNNELKDGR